MDNKLYSVNELSEIFEISKQALYKKKKSDPTLTPFWTTVNNVLHLDQNGFNILKTKLDSMEDEDYDELNEVEQEEIKVEQEFNEVESGLNIGLLIGSYKDHINDLRAQLDSKDNQINNLNETISTQSELLKNMQILLKENKDQLKILEAPKKSIFSKIFKKE